MPSERRRFPATAEAAGAARRWLADVLGRFGIDDDGTAALLLSELVTNAYRHAGTPVDVEARRDGAVLRIGVSDGSPTPPRRLHVDQCSPSGRGLGIVESLADRWGVAADTSGAGGKTIWFELPA